MHLVGGEDVHFRIPFARQLSELGFCVSVSGTAGDEYFANCGIPFSAFTMSRRLAPLSDVRTIRQLEQLLRRLRPDIVHAFDTKPGLLLPFAAQRAGEVRVVRTVTGMGSLFSSSSLRARVMQGIYKRMQVPASARCQMTVFQNRDDQEFFLSNALVDAGDQCLIRGSGIDPQAFERSAADLAEVRRLRNGLAIGGQVVFVMIARLVEEKGVIEYLEAARQVRRANSRAAFLLVGPIDLKARSAVSRERIDAYAGDVTYLGERSDIVNVLSLADVLVLPTKYREGIPRVLLEAAAAGLPLVATDMPGCRDVVRDGTNGLLVASGDISGLVGAISALLRSPELRRDMGASGADIVRREFALTSIVQAYADIYLGLWGRGSSA